MPCTSKPTDTALGAAFVAAGYVPPEERIVEIGRAAYLKWPHANAAGARRDYVIAQLRGEATFALMFRFAPAALTTAISALLAAIYDEIEAERPERDAGRPAGGGQLGRVAHLTVAPAETSRPAVEPPRTVAARVFALGVASRLDAVRIDGKPLRLCTAAEARAWAAKADAEGRTLRIQALFVLALASGLDGGDVLGERWRDEREIEKLYARAEAHHAA